MSGTIETSGTDLAIRFRYNPEVVEKVKRLGYTYGQRSKWDPENKLWIIPGWLAGKAAEELASFGRSGNVALAYQETLTRRGILNRKLEVDVPNATPDGRILYAHQRDVIQTMVQSSCIVAHDMGLGKTVSSLVASRLFMEGYPECEQVVAIVAPNTISQWEDEWKMAAPDLPLQIAPWSKIPDPPSRRFVLIADEAHRAQTLKSQRTQAFLRLAVNPLCMRVWCLTGTPMRNGKPVNLYPLLLAVDCPVALDRMRYETRYCDGQETRFTKWDTNGSSNNEELRQRTHSFIHRKRKAECLDLPAKTRIVHPCEVDTKTRKLCYKKFDAVYSNFLKGVQQRLAGWKDANPKASPSDQIAQRKRLMRSAAVASLNAIRQGSSLAKIDTAVELCLESVGEGNRVVLFACYQETIETLAREAYDQGLAVSKFHGGMPDSHRVKHLALFKNGSCPIFATTPESGGVGLNLQEASVVIMLDRPYSPGDAAQAEDRCHRIGTAWPVTVYWLQAFPVDRVVDEMLLEKIESIEDVLEGGRLDEWEILRRLIEE